MLCLIQYSPPKK